MYLVYWLEVGGTNKIAVEQTDRKMGVGRKGRLGFGRSKTLHLRTNLPHGWSDDRSFRPPWASCWHGAVRPYCHPCDGERGLFQRLRLGHRLFNCAFPIGYASVWFDYSQLSQLW